MVKSDWSKLRNELMWANAKTNYLLGIGKNSSGSWEINVVRHHWDNSAKTIYEGIPTKNKAIALARAYMDKN